MVRLSALQHYLGFLLAILRVQAGISPWNIHKSYSFVDIEVLIVARYRMVALSDRRENSKSAVLV